MLKLKRLKIHKLPRVKPGTELVFNDGINVLLGINGSGKTTLLKLLASLISGQLQPYSRADCHVEWSFENEGGTFSLSVEHFSSVQHGAQQSRPTRIKLTARSPVRNIIASHENNTITTTYDGKTERHQVSETAVTLSLRSIFQQAWHPWSYPLYWTNRLDESTHWLEGVTDLARIEAEDPYSDLVVGASAFENLVLRLIEGGTEQDIHQITAEQLPVLQTVAAALGCKSASFQFDLQHKQRLDPEDFFRYTFGDFRFRFVKADGTRLTHHELSFGQQRLLAFHFYAAMHPEVIVADELTNGMHHAMIGECIDLIGERQAFLATQNPLLLDNLPGFTSAEQVQSTFILCTTERENDRERMVWRNMTAEEAGNFFRDYQVGISHTNDILRSWGLW